ncbi:Crp/Fnr family transcriptional regulator [Qipengyuania spongiae]|uniref:Crp/Fnr family transcriptional regulator n=1 Tax=Qipengyuania spongiae TaxID=2909673 RepID=A0ABY5SZD6_9SPHN|nr:Crp/Fnr family transcriptional regulator [Qipengyuania spongiae]UVI38478.1 Crp/Fnr family transcriptional regulator [Qipengyuania spongiae]
MSLGCAACPVRDRAACSVLAEDERDALARLGRLRTVRRGETLFSAGSDPAACATLTSGALKIASYGADGAEHILALVHPAGFVGELFQPFVHHDVVALVDSTLCVFAGPDMAAAIEHYPALARALLRRTQEDLHASRSIQALAGRNSGRARVAGMVLAFAQAASDSPCHPAPRFDLPLSRGEMANMVGLTIETVSRQLTALERAGAIARDGKRGIELLDPALLAAACD